jgi:hypothetical protein
MTHGPDPRYEYVVYTYDNTPSDHVPGTWKRHMRTNDRDQAVRAAQALYGSCEYARVEVKRKGVGLPDGEMHDETIKVYGVKKRWFSKAIGKICGRLLHSLAAATAGFFVAGP